MQPETEADNFIKKLAQVFSCEFSKIIKNTYYEKHLWTTASGYTMKTYVEIEPQKYTAFNLSYLH